MARPKIRKEPAVTFSVKIDKSEKERWQEIAGPKGMNRMIREAVNTYIDGLAHAE